MRSNVVAQCLLLDCCAVAGRWADALSIFEHLEPSKELWWLHGGSMCQVYGKSMKIAGYKGGPQYEELSRNQCMHTAYCTIPRYS